MDFYFANHGSIALLTPLTNAAHEWTNEHLIANNEQIQFFGLAVVIEPRYVGDILRGLQNDGLTVGC